jgi:hypothetical protein
MNSLFAQLHYTYLAGFVPTLTLAPKGKGGRDSATGSRTLAQTAGGKRKGLIWDLVKDVESVIKKLEDGNKTSEQRWV